MIDEKLWIGKKYCKGNEYNVKVCNYMEQNKAKNHLLLYLRFLFSFPFFFF